MQEVQSIHDPIGTSENWLLSLEDVDINDSGWHAGESTVEMGGGGGGGGEKEAWGCRREAGWDGTVVENQNVSVKAGISACRQSSHLHIHAPGLQT